MEMQQFFGAEPGVEAKFFGKKTDFAAYRDVVGRRSEDKGFAAAWLDEPEQHFDGGTFSRAVRAEETEDLAARDLEREAANRDFVAKLLTQSVRFDGELGGGRQSPSRKGRLLFEAPAEDDNESLGWKVSVGLVCFPRPVKQCTSPTNWPALRHRWNRRGPRGRR